MSNGKKCGAILFSLNFLWLLSLFQDKESDKLYLIFIFFCPDAVGIPSFPLSFLLLVQKKRNKRKSQPISMR